VSLDPHVLVPGTLAGEVAGAVIPLDATTLHHLRRVLRRADGSALTLTDGAGARGSAEFVDDGARLVAAPHITPRPAPRLVLAQSLAKGRRADDAVRTACELGVDGVVPVVAERTQGRPDAHAAAAVVGRWQALAVSALEQSRGVHLAQVGPTRTTAELADVETSASIRILTVPGAEPLPQVLRRALVRDVPSDRALADPAAGEPVEELWVAIGPEGGWSAAEMELLVGAGWSAAGLGPTVLRTEHAGPVAVAVVAALAGRWQGVPTDDAGGEG
jgi:16S rRNA (uracil1498-N3)-methyltransferase